VAKALGAPCDLDDGLEGHFSGPPEKRWGTFGPAARVPTSRTRNPLLALGKASLIGLDIGETQNHLLGSHTKGGWCRAADDRQC
jgi:hypothetical protein